MKRGLTNIAIETMGHTPIIRLNSLSKGLARSPSDSNIAIRAAHEYELSGARASVYVCPGGVLQPSLARRAPVRLA